MPEKVWISFLRYSPSPNPILFILRQSLSLAQNLSTLLGWPVSPRELFVSVP